jgi:CHAT domain-containing protein/Tfp pilus assembly protein PilF
VKVGRSCIFLAFLFRCVSASAQPQPADELVAHARQVTFEQGARVALPEFERALVLYQKARNQHGEAVTLGYIGFSYYNLSEYQKALDYLQRALRMKEQLGDRLEQGKTLGHLGLVYWALGNYAQAIREHTNSLAIARQMGDPQLEGSELNNLGLVHDEVGDYSRSLQEYQEALKVNRAIGFARGEGDALGNIGGWYLLLGRYTDALPYYEQSLALDERRNLRPSMSLDLGNLGLCLSAMGRTTESLAAFDRALKLARETGQKKDEADWHKGKGSTVLRSGKYDAALAEYRLALEIYQQAGLQRELIEGLQDLGNLHIMLGDAASAEAEFRQAMEAAQKIGHPRGVTTSLMALGDLEWRRKRYQQAITLYQDALTRARQSNNRGHVAASLVKLAVTDTDLHRTREALQNAEQALEAARAMGSRPLESEALLVIGESERGSEQFTRALEHYTNGETIAKTVDDLDLGWRFSYAQGQALEALDRPQEAIRAYERAVKLIESVRSQLREDRFRAGYIEDKYQVYVSLVRLLLKLGRIPEAFGFAEKMRGQSYAALLSRSAPRAQSQAEVELRERIRQLQRQLDEENAKSPSDRRGQKSAAFSTALAEAEHAYQNLLDDLRAADPDYAAARTSAPPPIEELQRRLTGDTALIEYVSTESSLGIFVLTSRGLQATTSPLCSADLRSKVELLRDLLARGSSADWRKPAESLRRFLVDPIERTGWLDKITKLYIVPHGTLHYLPFGLLPKAGANRYLIEDYVLAYLPAAAALVRQPGPAADRTLFAVAPARTKLTYAQEEARSIGEFFPSEKQVLVGASATESSFKRDASRYQVLHLATHGYFNKLNPLFSALELEADQTDDGRLEVHEILNLRLKADLVALSACETALGSGYFAEAPAGDDFVGLTRAFLYAGSTAVLATLWEVNDRSALDLMRSFYRALPRLGKAQGLAEAQRAALRQGGRYAHPYFWAPFVLVGEMK